MDASFRALADPTRREILRRLRERPHTSGELAAGFGTSWPTVSRHLGVLRAAGLVLAARDGQQVIYELNTTVLHDVVEHLLAWIRPDHAAAPDAAADTRSDPPATATPSPTRDA